MTRMMEIENLCCGYAAGPAPARGAAGNPRILDQLNFTLEKGQFLSIIGPNGSGKTTLVKALTGLLAPESGQVRLKGKPLDRTQPRERARLMAAVHQAMDPVSLTVEAYVCLGRLPYFKPFQFFETRADKQVARRYMELTGTLAFRGAKMNQISGGEQQLAAMARALTQEPQILVLDEPTAHLDITHQARIMALVSRLKAQTRLTVVMVQHDLNLAAQFSDRLILLDKKTGRIAGDGPPESVLTRDVLEPVYQTRIRIGTNPVSGRPSVFPDSPDETEHAFITKGGPCHDGIV